MKLMHRQAEIGLSGNVDHFGAPNGEEGHGHWLGTVVGNSNGNKRTTRLANVDTIYLSNARLAGTKCDQTDHDAQVLSHGSSFLGPRLPGSGMSGRRLSKRRHHSGPRGGQFPSAGGVNMKGGQFGPRGGQ
jgi:hypothetical protein